MSDIGVRADLNITAVTSDFDPKATFAGRFRRASLSLSRYDALSWAKGKQCEGVTSSH
jgi:hypothetical protein